MAKNCAKIWHVYIDETTEEIPRVFYVGKGTPGRLYKKERNIYWKRIVAKYGYRRIAILSTKDEAYSFEIEILEIKKYKTFEKNGEGWGANLTIGGRGTSGVPKERKQKQSAQNLGKNNPMFGKVSAFFGKQHSSDTKRQMSEAHIGKKFSEEHKQNLSKSKTGMFLSETHKQKVSIATAGENNPKALLTSNVIPIIRQKYATGNYTQLQLAKEYNVSVSCIMHIVNNGSWKIDKEEHIKLKELRLHNIKKNYEY